MITTLSHNHQTYTIDLSKPLDISIPLSASKDNVNAWYLDEPKITPVIDGDWIGQVAKGGSVNFNTILFNPHAHGTHTECVGHISHEFHSINQTLQRFFFVAELITITPKPQGEDFVITKNLLEDAISYKNQEALIIRTLPNTFDKTHKQYSHTNWPYLSKEAATYIRNLGIMHLLIDLPSVDKEKDEGKLEAHKAFWNYPNALRHKATITEMVYVPNSIDNGLYWLNLQIAPFENDASPSKPLLYSILK